MSSLDADTVAAYLRQHPDFLSDHPDLALSLRAPRADGATTQLASYQIELLRERNSALQQRLRSLIEVAHDNEAVLQRLHLLALRLLAVDGWQDAVYAVMACLREDFRAEQPRLLLIGAPPLPAAPWLLQQAIDDARLAPLAAARAAGRAVCGRLERSQLALLFGEAAPAIASAALLPLRDIGVLAIGSSDTDRFHPGIGTDLLDRMAELIGTALRQAARRRQAAQAQADAPAP